MWTLGESNVVPHKLGTPTNPAVRVLRHGKTPVFPPPFPFDFLTLEKQNKFYGKPDLFCYVDLRGIEPLSPGCKPGALPLS